MNSLKVNHIYRHFKGDLYQVVDVAKYSETEENYVIYRALYGEGQLWVTPESRFLSLVNKRKYPEVSQEYRFELQEIKSVSDRYEYNQNALTEAIDYEHPVVIGFHGNEDPYYEFSNEAPSPFTFNGITFTCMEQYLMYQKAVLFKDFDVAERILQTADPEQMRVLGRQAKPYDHRWDNPQDILMKGLREKFLQNPVLCKELLDTGNALLAECCRTDHKWGIGLIPGDPRVASPEKWRGRNLLGYSLMQVRGEILKMKSGVPDEEIRRKKALKIFVVNDDITKLEVDAILCPTDEKLSGSRDVEAEIMEAAGPTLYLECQTRGGIQVGDSFITRGYKLPAEYVIHTAIPKWEDGNAKEGATLARCLRKSLAIAAANGIHTVAIPSISEDEKDYPLNEAAKYTMRTIVEYMRNNPDANLGITIAVNDNVEKYQYERALSHFSGKIQRDKTVHRKNIDYNTEKLDINFNDVVFLATGVADGASSSSVVTIIENRAYEINIYKMTRATLLQMLPNEHFTDFMSLLNQLRNPGKPLLDGWAAEILGIGYSLYMRDYVHVSFANEMKNHSDSRSLKEYYQDLAIRVLSKI